MAKLELNNISNISGAESTAIATINNNSTAIETALENTLSRNGASPNTMNADIDLNGNDLLNVGTVDADNLTIAGVDYTDSLQGSVAEAEAAATAAALSETNAATSADEAAASAAEAATFDPDLFTTKANNGSDFADPAATLANLGGVSGTKAGRASLGVKLAVAGVTALSLLTTDDVAAAGDHVNLLYHTSAADGGGGLFQVLEGDALTNGLTVDGGTVIEGIGVTLKRVIAPGEEITSAMFGMDMTGATDAKPDTVKLIDAMFAYGAPGRIGKGDVFIASADGGTNTGAIEIIDYDGLTLRGDPYQTSITLADNINTSVFYFLRCNGLKLEGINIDGNGDNQTFGMGLRLKDCADPTIKGCDLSHTSRSAILLENDCLRPIVVENRIHDLTYTTDSILRCGIQSTSENPDNSPEGAHVTGALLAHNMLWNLGTASINMAGSERTKILGNDIFDDLNTPVNGFAAIRVDNGSKHCVMSGNTIFGTCRGFFLGDLYDCTVTDNAIYGTQWEGIAVFQDHFRPYRLKIHNNIILDPCTTVAPSAPVNPCGILLASLERSEIHHNRIVSTNGNMENGICEVFNGSAPPNQIYDNYGSGHTVSFELINDVFTPACTFTSPGDFAPTYVRQVGYDRFEGNIYKFWIRLTFTPGTFAASGSFRITGLRKTSWNRSNLYFPVNDAGLSGLTFNANELAFKPFIFTNTNFIQAHMYKLASAAPAKVSPVAVGNTHVVSGVAGDIDIILYGEFPYQMEAAV